MSDKLKKPSLVQRILEFLKSDDNSKVSRFAVKLDKYFSKQIQMRRDKIENLNEKIVDATENLENAVLEVDVTRLTSTDGADGYCPVYVGKLDEKLKVIEAFQEQIKNVEEEIERLQKLKDVAFGSVEAE